MTGGLTVRPAAESDAAVLAALRYEFRRQVGRVTEAEDTFLERCRSWFADQLRQSGRWRCWVAEDDGIVGQIWIQLIEKLPMPAPGLTHHAFLTALYVQPTARNRGIGAALIDAATRWCEANAVDTVFLRATPLSGPLYARRGFEATDNVMEQVVTRTEKRP